MSQTKKPKRQEDNSPKIHQKEKINFELKIRELPWTDRQKEIIDAVLNKKADILKNYRLNKDKK